MIILVLDRLIGGSPRGEAGHAARVRVEGGEVQVDGPEPELIDKSQPVLSVRDGRTIVCADDPEEWVRGLAVSFRTPYLSARIVEDTSPPTDIEIEIDWANVREPALR